MVANGMSHLTTELLRKIVYSSFRKAWEDDHQASVISPNTVYVTEVCQCLLRSWLNRTLKAPPSDNKVVLMVLGDSTHYIMKDYFPLGEGEHTSEKVVDGTVKIVGRADRVLEDVVIEFKTVSRLPESPYEIHINQVQLYMWLFDKTKALLVYVSRANGDIKTFEVQRDDGIINGLVDRAKMFSKLLKNGKVPKAEESSLCAFCEYRELCANFKSKESKMSNV